MSEDVMDLQAMVGKSPDAHFLRDMIGFAAKRPMELEVAGLTGAAYGGEGCRAACAAYGYRARLREEAFSSRTDPRPRLCCRAPDRQDCSA